MTFKELCEKIYNLLINYKKIEEKQSFEESLEAQITVTALEGLWEGLLENLSENKGQNISPQVIESLKTLLNERWDRIRGTDLSYPSTPDYPINQLCIGLADILAANIPDSVRNSLLMPTVQLRKRGDAADDDFDIPLHQFVLSDDDRHFIKISDCLVGAEEDGILMHTSIIGEEKEREQKEIKTYAKAILPKVKDLSKTEASRVRQHSIQAIDYSDAITDLVDFREKGGSIGGALRHLKKYLLKGGAHGERGGEELIAAENANLAIVNFKAFLDTLNEEEKKKVFELKAKGKSDTLGVTWERLSDPLVLGSLFLMPPENKELKEKDTVSTSSELHLFWNEAEKIFTYKFKKEDNSIEKKSITLDEVGKENFEILKNMFDIKKNNLLNKKLNSTNTDLNAKEKTAYQALLTLTSRRGHTQLRPLQSTSYCVELIATAIDENLKEHPDLYNIYPASSKQTKAATIQNLEELCKAKKEAFNHAMESDIYLMGTIKENEKGENSDSSHLRVYREKGGRYIYFIKGEKIEITSAKTHNTAIIDSLLLQENLYGKRLLKDNLLVDDLQKKIFNIIFNSAAERGHMQKWQPYKVKANYGDAGKKRLRDQIFTETHSELISSRVNNYHHLLEICISLLPEQRNIFLNKFNLDKLAMLLTIEMATARFDHRAVKQLEMIATSLSEENHKILLSKIPLLNIVDNISIIPENMRTDFFNQADQRQLADLIKVRVNEDADQGYDTLGKFFRYLSNDYREDLLLNFPSSLNIAHLDEIISEDLRSAYFSQLDQKQLLTIIGNYITEGRAGSVGDVLMDILPYLPDKSAQLLLTTNKKIGRAFIKASVAYKILVLNAASNEIFKDLIKIIPSELILDLLVRDQLDKPDDLFNARRNDIIAEIQKTYIAKPGTGHLYLENILKKVSENNCRELLRSDFIKTIPPIPDLEWFVNFMGTIKADSRCEIFLQSDLGKRNEHFLQNLHGLVDMLSLYNSDAVKEELFGFLDHLSPARLRTLVPNFKEFVIFLKLIAKNKTEHYTEKLFREPLEIIKRTIETNIKSFTEQKPSAMLFAPPTVTKSSEILKAIELAESGQCTWFEAVKKIDELLNAQINDKTHYPQGRQYNVNLLDLLYSKKLSQSAVLSAGEHQEVKEVKEREVKVSPPPPPPEDVPPPPPEEDGISNIPH